MRGENSIDTVKEIFSAGTSPRARGKLWSLMWSLTASRNIPACAGKTVSPGVRLNTAKEHPRVRGENGLG